jgi:hypothetical protein
MKRGTFRQVSGFLPLFAGGLALPGMCRNRLRGKTWIIVCNLQKESKS